MSNVTYTCPIGGEEIWGTQDQADNAVPCLPHFEEDNGSDQTWHTCRQGCKVAFNSEERRDDHEANDHLPSCSICDGECSGHA